MILIDVNVLVYAHRAEMAEHGRFRSWLAGVVDGAEPFGVPALVLSGFVRVVTQRVFKPPTPVHVALDACNAIMASPACRIIHPGAAHWDIFDRLCRAVDAKGKLVPDAYLAAMALEHNLEMVSADADFRVFPGLKWRHPLSSQVTTNPL